MPLASPSVSAGLWCRSTFSRRDSEPGPCGEYVYVLIYQVRNGSVVLCAAAVPLVPGFKPAFRRRVEVGHHWSLQTWRLPHLVALFSPLVGCTAFVCICINIVGVYQRNEDACLVLPAAGL